MAARCTNRNDRTGQTEAVKNPLAVTVLAWSFPQLIIAGGDLQMLRLTDSEAAAFPGYDAPAFIRPQRSLSLPSVSTWTDAQRMRFAGPL